MFEEEYDDEGSIPSNVRHLYKKSGEKFVLIGAGEMKSSQDVVNVQESLRKEREDHKATKRKLAAFGDMDPEEVHAKLDRFDELEAAAGGKIDETKINEMVESRIKSKTAPLQRELDVIKKERDELKGTISEHQAKEVRRLIHDTIRTAATTAKIRDTALADAQLLAENIFMVDENGRVITKDGISGVTPGIDPTVWLTEAKNTRPHWWPESQGVGAKGGQGGAGGNNPFSADNWNMTEQGKLVRENPERAAQMAKAAGTTVGGPRPQKK
jgi:hypothetical protein